jgi:hypothetical protein
MINFDSLAVFKLVPNEYYFSLNNLICLSAMPYIEMEIKMILTPMKSQRPNAG